MKISLYHRFVVLISLLLVFVVAAVLFVVEESERRTMYIQEIDQAMIIAENLAFMNIRPLFEWQTETLQRNADAQLSDRLLYVVFYDRNGTPLASSQSVLDRAEIVCCSHFRGDIRPGAAHVSTRTVRIRDRDQPALELEIPIFADDSPETPTRWGSVKIGRSLDEMRSEINRIRSVLIAIGLGGVALGLFASVLLAKRIARPLQNLAAGTVRVARGDFSRRIEPTSRDEIGDLARSFNEMTDRLLEARESMAEANRRLVQAEKLASIGRLAATIAHEIRNPLTSVKLNVQKIAESPDLDEVEREHVAISREGIAQIEKFIKELLEFTRTARLQLESFPLDQILDESLKLFQEMLRQKAVVLAKSYAPGLPEAKVDGDRMRQVFLNLLRNAHEAVERGGRIDIALDEVAEDGGRRLRVRIGDDGHGIRAEDRDNIFEPFYTTKSSGFGLGLANARKIVEQHGGTIRIADKDGPGSLFEVLIPVEEAP